MYTVLSQSVPLQLQEPCRGIESEEIEGRGDRNPGEKEECDVATEERASDLYAEPGESVAHFHPLQRVHAGDCHQGCL